jgi:teichuronic acid exporter
MSKFKKSLLSATFWSIGGQISSMSIALISNIILARILSPAEFGQVGVVMFFITIGSVFTEGGFGGALIRKKEATSDDFATIFTVNLFVSLLCFFLIFIFSNSIARFYNDLSLRNLLIASALMLIVNSFTITGNAKLIRDLKFKLRSLYRFLSILLASIAGIVLAYENHGVWSLIILNLLNPIFYGFFLAFSGNLSFRIKFKSDSFKEMYSFGINTSLASLLNVVFDNIYSLILGKYFSMSQVGYYYQAKKLQDVPTNVINLTVQSVVFSSLAKLQDDKQGFFRAYNKIVLLFTLLMGIITILIYLYSEQILVVLFGRTWINAGFFLQLLCLASFFYLQEMLNRMVFKVFDQTKRILYLEIVKKAIQSISIVLGLLMMDINILIIGFVLVSAVSYIINYHYTKKIFGLTGWFEMRLVLKVILVSIISTWVHSLIVEFFQLGFYIQFVVGPFTIFLYVALLRLLKIDIFSEVKLIVSLLK